MKYATWNLNFANAEYGTGPEMSVSEQGFFAEGAWTAGEVADGSLILGYYDGNPTNLQPWNFTEVTQEQALAFAQAIDATAFLLEDGTIGVTVNRIAAGL